MKRLVLSGALASLLFGGAAFAGDKGSKELSEADARERCEQLKAAIENAPEDERASNQTNYTERAEFDRLCAPTVYDDSATGGGGVNEQIITDDGEIWDTQSEPHGDEPDVETQE